MFPIQKEPVSFFEKTSDGNKSKPREEVKHANLDHAQIITSSNQAEEEKSDRLKPKNKKELADAKSVLNFSKKPKDKKCKVKTSVRVRPFFQREELVEERKHPGYKANGNLICVQGKQTKFEIIKFNKIFSE